ncbi:MAG: nuclease-related domain-containing protein [Candidatus Promineifilaceae bacterium]
MSSVQTRQAPLVILRDDARIARLAKRGQQASLVGLVFLLGGFVLVFVSNAPNLILLQLVALLIGFVISQAGAYLLNRYGRSPRPDQVLDDALRGAARGGRLYHFALPSPHILLAPAGLVVFNLKFQGGRISVSGRRWRQTGLGLRRFFGQEGLGNPTKEVETMLASLTRFIREQAPEVADQELPIGALIVFTAKSRDNLDLAGSDIPAMHASKVKGFLRQKSDGQRLTDEAYSALQAAFDRKAGQPADDA